MATSIYERFKLGALELNSATGLEIESLTFTPAAKKPSWATNNDADGDALVKESHYSNSTFEMRVRVQPQATIAAALSKLGELTNAVQQCEREEGGLTLTWIPAGTESTYTAYALVGEHTEIPLTPSGEGAGWFINAPVVQIKLTCRPFLYTAERTAKAATESGAEPLQTLYVKEIKGDVPAEARLIVKDKATQDRRFAQWGRDIVASESNPALLITAASLVTTEFSGEAKTRSGAYSEEKVKRATALAQETTICGTGRITHVGSFAVYLRPYSGSTSARYRISYRNGDGPLIPLEWKQPPVAAEFADLYMGEVALDAVDLGTQTSEIRVEHKSAGAAHENDINYLLLIPTRASARARGVAQPSPSKLLAYDPFNQTEGNLATKSLTFGGTWSGAGDAVDFKVIAASHLAQRTETLDASRYAGRYAIAGSTEATTCKVQCDGNATKSTESGSNAAARGVFARYTNTENWVMAYLESYESGSTRARFVVVKNVAGVQTQLGVRGELGELLPTEWWSGSGVVGKTMTVALYIGEGGLWQAWAYEAGTGEATPLLEGTDTDFAVGGSLAKGKVGFYDVWMGVNAMTRQYDNFQATLADAANRVCYSGRQIEFNSDEVLRQDASGTYDGQPDISRGGDFYLDPGGESGRINRIAVRMRRNDVEAERDTAVTDKHTAEILVTERYLLPR